MEIRILCLQKAEEEYIFLYHPGQEMEAIGGLIRYSRDPRLSLSWSDVHLVARELMATRRRRFLAHAWSPLATRRSGAQSPLLKG